MYDTSFDHEGSHLRRSDRRVLWALRIAALFATIAAVSSDAQIPSSQILQNAWVTPGIIGAVNITGGSDGSLYAAAGSWAPSSAHIQLSGGIGYEARAGGHSSAAYGVRLAVPFSSSTPGAFGFSGFVGAGGGGRSRTSTVVVGASSAAVIADSAESPGQFAAGIGAGWRHAFGATHGMSFYATPTYLYCAGGTDPGGLFRAAIAADFGISSRIGATVGFEFGGTRPRAIGGPSGTLYGAGVSYVIGRR
jgi:hypothetical protein